MNNLYNNAGLRIRELREHKKFTRESLAEMADISPKFLYEIEQGKKGFSADTLYRLANALSVNCDYILCGKYDNCNDLTILGLFNNKQIKDVNELLKLVYKLSNN